MVSENSQYIKDYFKFDCAPSANKKAVVQGETYRFTVLTSKMIRLEYNENGMFENRPSQTVWFRDLEVPAFTESKEKGIVKISTNDLVLEYNTSKKFSRSSLKITLQKTGKTWKYGQSERRNLKGTRRTLDVAFGPTKLEKGLLSKDGFSVLDDSSSLVFNEDYWLTTREQSNIDLYFFGYGKEYLECLRDYYKISGKTPMIPRYILGNWWSRYWEYNEQELKDLIKNFEFHKIPLSVCIIDMDWHLVNIDKKYGNGWTGYTWNKEFFPDPEGMLNWLHEKDLKVSLNLHPAKGIRGHEDCYPKLAEFMGVDTSIEEPVDFNIADPKFTAGYFDLVHHPLEERGVDFWWMDWQQGKKTNLEGLDPLWMLNHLHYYDLGRDGTNRSFVFSRWGGYGNHRYPIGFSGDTFVSWKMLKFLPYFTATASNIGYGWWSHDIGGHMLGTEKSELYTRWVQFGVFSPIMRLHSTKMKFHKREPWRFDLNTLQYAGDMMRLRHQLIPYIYTMAYRNYSDDIPLICPLYYLAPEIKEAYKKDYRNEYWFGSEFLYSPITSPVHKRAKRVLHKTYFPPHTGGFFNFFTGEYFNENSEATRAYNIPDVPLFAKAGAIIPLNEENVKNGTANPDSLVIEIFPGASNEFSLYEDDGDSEDYKQDLCFKTIFNMDWAENENNFVTFTVSMPTIKANFIPDNRSITLRFHCVDPSRVDTISFECSEKLIKFDENSWSKNQEKNLIEIIIPSINFKSLQIRFTKPEIIKNEFFFEQAEEMLMDSNLGTILKLKIDKTVPSKEKFTESDLISLYRKISKRPKMKYLLVFLFLIGFYK